MPLKRSVITFAGERGAKINQKVFPSSTLYFTFISQKDATIEIRVAPSDSSLAQSKLTGNDKNRVFRPE